ncbi:capsule biosynthesis protein [Acinetobacter lanii]|uniref:Capsular biosynthesis protein n=1 Tax=Acinetobacter lanii TaxID=2715163 RepID=A0A6G8S7N2_9GAMM|nr:capsular biosynthesis protein [Acinetobacter lanii]QIO10167.1 capsular biosynthesis protein [Acinetobacter lanii]
MSIHIDQLLLSKKVLLLQGPMGKFFKQFSHWLQQYQIETYKINFNGGDRFFFDGELNCYDFIQPMNEFNDYIEAFIVKHQIDSIVCFGDCRPQHRIAKIAAYKLNITFFAFEEGYIRPNYITFEQDGVNFYSNFTQTLSLNLNPQAIPIEPIEDAQNSYWRMVWCAIIYYVLNLYYEKSFPHYKHHRNLTTSQEFWSWIWSVLKRIQHYITEPLPFKKLIKQYSKQYYVFALQVHNDSQILIHSEFKNMEQYIEHVIESFVLNADPSHHLVLKHHPMDRGYRNYRKLINKLAKRYGMKGRLHYFCDIHLPTLLKHSLGMVAVNSTTVLQALYHHIPVKVLGYAMYNLPRLTNQYPLCKFWKDPGEVDDLYYQYFRSHLIQYSQLNGSYYGKSPWMHDHQASRSDHVKNIISDTEHPKTLS